MKLIIAIVNNDDSATVQRALTQAGFSATKLATTGGILKNGNTTYLIGVASEHVDRVIEILKNFSRKRNEPVIDDKSFLPDSFSNAEAIDVGGATVLVLNIERFEKL